MPAIDIALAELVKNAYDADATECDITVTGSQARTQQIVISDNGVGMDLRSVRDSWLLIGHSSKDHSAKTKRFHRIPLGEKGLGRLAALRLGRTVLLETRPLSEPGVKYRLEINWDKLDRARTVDGVKLRIQRLSTTEKHGTTITLSRLRSALGVSEIRDLSERLALLQGPFTKHRAFRVLLDHPRFQALISETGAHYLEDADLKLTAKLSRNGKAEYELLDWTGTVIASGTGSRRYRTVPAKFELWMYLLNAQRFSARPRVLTLAARKQWFDAFGGVFIFEGPLRVAPYGGPGDDWLGLNLKRVASPEERPSTNNSVGRLVISPAQKLLQQKTDRLGYLNNAAFQELKDFCNDALTWTARWRLERAEERRRRRRRSIEVDFMEARAELSASTQELPEPLKTRVERAADKLLVLDQERSDMSTAERQLYRSLATIGILGTSFAHELDKPLNVARDNLGELRKYLEGQGRASRQLNLLSSALDRAEPYVSIPLALIKREKRRWRPISLSDSVVRVFELYDPLLAAAGIATELPQVGFDDKIYGTNALVESVIANLITNSIAAFDRPIATASQRKIRVTVQSRGKSLIMLFADNAGGIAGIDRTEVWLPGRTTTARGNGFGLTIVRDCIADLRGQVDVDSLSAFGGAEFAFSFSGAE